MAGMTIAQRAGLESWADEDVIARVMAGEKDLYEVIMRRYNQRLYRIARAILHQDDEAEDVVQDAYVRAYEHLEQFLGRARFATWLTKIAVHEALARVRKINRVQDLETMNPEEKQSTLTAPAVSPEHQASRNEMGRFLEESILSLPDHYRVVLVMRDIEEMSTADTADALELSQENVKIRLHRARLLLREELMARAGASRGDAFPFLGARCDRMVQAVMERIANL
jgi:RNA polymerase sigma-70 factor, ECF subfamily